MVDRYQFDRGEEVILTDDWLWQGKHNYSAVNGYRPLKGTVGVIVHSVAKGVTYAVVDFSEATGQVGFQTLSTDVSVLEKYMGISDEEVDEAIRSIVKGHP